jgi:hypothetical protein
MSSKLFEDSKTRKLLTHKSFPTNIHMWKQYHSYRSAKSDALICIFRCPMKTYLRSEAFILNHQRLEAYIQSTAFQNNMLPVDTAQCDNFFGFGNFTREVFDMDPNICKCHLHVF